MIIIKMILSDDNNDNHNTGQAFRTYISIELTYQVISSLIFQVPGTQSLHFKCPALATLISKMPVIQHLCIGCPELAAQIFELPGIQNLCFKCSAAGHKVILFNYKNIQMATLITMIIVSYLLIIIIIIKVITESHKNYCSVGVMELCLSKLLILILCFLCNSYCCLLLDILPYVIDQESHVYFLKF